LSFEIFATDVDGTLSPDRKSTKLCLDVVAKLQQLEEMGVKVVLVSSNALPIVVGLSKYMGLSGLAIGETGSLVYVGGNKVIHLTQYSARKALFDVIEKFSEYVESSWQNRFRLHDYALKVKKRYLDQALEVYGMIREYVEKEYDYLRVSYSGYAIHLTPRDVSKGKALKYILHKLGVESSKVVCVGDSVMDADFTDICGLSAAVSNADDELKKRVHLILEKPSCYGVAELIEKILLKARSFPHKS